MVSRSKKATLSQAVRPGLVPSVFMDTSANTLMKYLDHLVDSLGVTNHSMTATDNAF